MIELDFSLDKQLLKRTDNNVIAANAVEAHECCFDFDSEWNGLEKSATFTRNGATYTAVLDANNSCTIPHEVLAGNSRDVIKMGVFGVGSNDVVLTSTTVNLLVEGGASTDGAGSQITPTLFEQIMARIAEIEQGTVSPEAIAQAVEDYLTENPIEAGLTEEEVIALITSYVTEHSAELKGDDGKSAYQIAVDNGFVGTETEWLESLHGTNGTNGTDGVTPTITATATVDNTSSSTPTVSVTKTGTDANPSFAFAFSGLKGADGSGGGSSDLDKFLDNVDVDYAFDSATNANYTVFRIYKNKLDGTKQYPFVRYKNMKSSLELAEEEGWFLTITGGLYQTSSSIHEPDGVVIENGEVLHNEINVQHAGSYPLLIDSDGNLNYAQADETGLDIMGNYNNIVSAVGGWQPIIENYQPLEQMAPVLGWTSNAQRMIIGQFGNGDYAVVTCEGRNFDHSDGWTMPEAISICQKLGLKFAYNLDGGGSVESVIGEKQFNTIYENAKGRKLSTFIVFTGSTSFIPEIGTTLSSISATKTDKEYTVGDTLNISDLVVIANYSDGTHANVTSSATIDTSSVDMTTAETYSISVSYTQSGVTKTDSISIVVSEPTVKTLTSITATKTQTSYDIGDTLSTSDIVVTAHYSDSTSADVTSSATIDSSSVDMSVAGSYTVNISYTEGEVTKSTTITITVSSETPSAYNFVYGYSLTATNSVLDDLAVSTTRVTALTQTVNDAPVTSGGEIIGYLIPVPEGATSITVQTQSGFRPAISWWEVENGVIYRRADQGWASDYNTTVSIDNYYPYIGVNVKNTSNTTISSSTDTSTWTIEFT